MAASDYVDYVYQDAVYALDSAAYFANSFDYLGNSAESFVINTLSQSALLGDPVNFNVSYNIETAPTVEAPSVTPTTPLPNYDGAWVNGISTFNDLVVPDFNAVMPTLNFPAPVSINEVSAPNSRPELDTLEVPDAPSFTLPTLPTLLEVTVPEDVNAVIPTFDFTFNLARPSPPTNSFAFNEQTYSSTLLTKALQLLEGDIESGGYGLRAEDELNIWNRAKDRINNAVDQEISEAEDNISARGFTLPVGAHNALIARATQNKTAQLSQVNNEIAIKRADLYVQARQFAVTTGLNSQQFLMQFHNQVQERSLNAARFMAEIALAHFDARVREYQLGLEQFRTEADVFRTRLEAARQATEIQRIKLESARLKGQINQDQIELYVAQFRGVEALTNIYNTQLQGVRVKAELQELKFRVYSEDIRAYVAQLDANSKRIDNFTALVGAETAKVDAYRSQAQAHSAVLDTVRARTDIQNSRIRTEIDSADLKLKGYASNLDGWAKEYDVALNNGRFILEKYGVDVNAWETKTRVGLNSEELRLKAHSTNVDNQLDVRKYNFERYKTEVDGVLKAFAQVSQNVANGGELFARLASASYSALNTIAAIIE